MFEYRWLEEGDYDNILVPWWKAWRWTPPKKDFLPDDGKSGIIVSKDGRDICACFLYFANSKTCFQEFLISDFNYREDDRGEAIDSLLNALCEVVLEQGYKYIFSSLKNENLMKRYKKCGFVKGSKGCTEMIRILA